MGISALLRPAFRFQHRVPVPSRRVASAIAPPAGDELSRRYIEASGSSRPYTEIPSLPHIALTTLKPDDNNNRNTVAADLLAHLHSCPNLKAAVGILPAAEQSTELIVASRDQAVAASPMEGAYEISQRLCSSDLVKQMAARYPSAYYPIKPLDTQGRACEMRLPGKWSLETVETALTEGRQANRYNQLQSLVENLPQGKRVAILLGGPSGAGKTTLVNKIREYAKGRAVTTIEGDMYFWGSDCPGGIPKTEKGDIYWDHERYMDIPRLQRDLSQLLATGEADLPVYDFNPRPGSNTFIGHRADEPRHVKVGPDDIIVVDSVHAVNAGIVDTLEKNELPYRIMYLDSPQAEDRLVRRVVREYDDARGHLAPQTVLDLWDSTTFRGEVEFMRPQLLHMDAARDLSMILQFPDDVPLTRKQISDRVALLKEYGLGPTYEAFRVSDSEIASMTRKEEQRLVDVLAQTKDEKVRAHAQRDLDQLRAAPRYSPQLPQAKAS